MTDAPVSIAAGAVRAQVLPEGGILWRPVFRLGGRRDIAPLAEAPWSADPVIAGDGALTPYMRMLGGAFLGLPFGGRCVPEGVPGWPTTPARTPHHGVCSVAHWGVLDHAAHYVTLRLSPPPPDLLEIVEQRIICHPTRPEIRVEVAVTTRVDATLPVGYHPIVRMPETTGALSIEATFESGHVFPFARNSAGRARPGVDFASLSHVPADGGAIDLSRHPGDARSEDLLLLTAMRGPIVIRDAEAGYRLTLDWDRTALPNVLLWLHDRAIDDYPWSGRFRGIGVEPGASPFDLAADDNPLRDAGRATSVAFAAGVTRTFTFTLSVDECTG